MESRPIRTSAQRVASHFLGEPYTTWAAKRRDDGATWGAIADELRDLTSGVVDVSRETVRYWYVTATETKP